MPVAGTAVADHPLVQGVPAPERPRALETAAALEAVLVHVRRAATVEPPIVFARTIMLAVEELRAASGRCRSPAIAAWQTAALRELGALLLEHIGTCEFVIEIGPDPRDARRDGWA